MAVAALVATGVAWFYQVRLKPYYFATLRLAEQATILQLKEEKSKEVNYKKAFAIVQECKTILDQPQPVNTLSIFQRQSLKDYGELLLKEARPGELRTIAVAVLVADNTDSSMTEPQKHDLAEITADTLLLRLSTKYGLLLADDKP